MSVCLHAWTPKDKDVIQGIPDFSACLSQDVSAITANARNWRAWWLKTVTAYWVLKVREYVYF